MNQRRGHDAINQQDCVLFSVTRITLDICENKVVIFPFMISACEARKRKITDAPRLFCSERQTDVPERTQEILIEVIYVTLFCAVGCYVCVLDPQRGEKTDLCGDRDEFDEMNVVGKE